MDAQSFNMAATSVLSGLLKGATWDEVTDYLSPAVLDIVSPRELSKELMQLSATSSEKGVGEHVGRSWQMASAVTSTVLSS